MGQLCNSENFALSNPFTIKPFNIIELVLIIYINVSITNVRGAPFLSLGIRSVYRYCLYFWMLSEPSERIQDLRSVSKSTIYFFINSSVNLPFFNAQSPIPITPEVNDLGWNLYPQYHGWAKRYTKVATDGSAHCFMVCDSL